MKSKIETLKSGDESSQGERDSFMCAAFELDFQEHRQEIETYANEHKDHFWGLAESLRHMKNPTPDQIQFIVETFAPQWPQAGHPGGLQVGGRQPWEASLAIVEMIEMLQNDMSKEATDALAHLAHSDRLGEYHRHIQQTYSTQRRRSLDLAETHLDLEKIRDVLCRGAPVGHKHLETIVMDALEDAEDDIRNGITNRIRAYQAAPQGRREGYCRDRMKEDLTPELEAHGISVIPEAQVTGEKRPDLLCQFSEKLRVPIEIKLNTSGNLWSALTTQLPNYARVRGVNDTVIYLVLWFGELFESRAPQCPFLDNRHAESHHELKKMLDACTDKVPYNLIPFVMDLSEVKARAPKRRPRRTSPSETDLLDKATDLDAGFVQMKEICSEHLAMAPKVHQSLTDKQRAAYGGCLHCITIIEHGKCLLRKAIQDRDIARVAATLVRPLIEWCVRVYWLLWLARDDDVKRFFSVDKLGKDMRLVDFVVDCRRDEEKQTGNRRFLDKYKVQPQVDNLHKFMHGGHKEMLSGFPTGATPEGFSDQDISDMILTFGDVMFMSFRNIAKIVKAEESPLGRIREHRDKFYDLFFPAR